MSTSADAITARLNRQTRSRRARFTARADSTFGGDLRVRSYRLGNGLDVHLLADPAAPVVSYQSWYRVGSRHEKKGKTGLAHFFEHLMFKETKNHPAGDFDRLFEAAGGETNAATWTDWTYYYDNVPARELPLAVHLEADRMQNLVLRAPAVASEKEVVMSERRYRVEDDVEGKANELLYSRAFAKHPYHWPTIGWMEDIEGYTVQDCRAFYGTYYAPNNATIIAAGDLDEYETLGLIREHYGSISAARIPKERRIVEPPQRRERRLTLRQPTDTEKLEIGWRGPAWGDRDYVVLTVLNEVLTGGRSSRLFRALVSEGELATSMHASPAPFAQPGLFELWADAREGVTGKELLAVIDRELGAIKARGIAATDLDKAHNRLELGFLSAMETASGKAEQLGFVATIVDDVSIVFDRLEAFRSVTAAEVQHLAKRLFKASQRTVIFVLPQDASVKASGGSGDLGVSS